MDMDQERFDISYAGSRILPGTSVLGNIKSEKDICLDGFIDGNVQCAGILIVNKKGAIGGDVNCDTLYLNGKIAGSVCVKYKAVLGKDAIIEGSLTTACMEITPGAKIRLGLKLKNASK